MYLSPAETMPSLAPYRPILVLSILAAPAALATGMFHRFSLRSPQIFLMLAFVGTAAFSWIYRGWFGGALAAVEYLGPTLAAFYLTATTLVSLRRHRVLAAALVLVAAYYVLLGVLAYHYGYQEERYIMLTWETDASGQLLRKTLRRIRGAGFLQDPNDLAQNLLIGLVFLWAFWRRGGWTRNFLLVVVPSIWLLYGLLLTRSRGVAVGLAVTLALAVRDRLGRTGSLLFSAVLAVALLAANFGGARALSLREGSIYGRLEAWSTGLQMLKQAPLFGVGFGAFTDYHELTAHNSFVHCFAELGMVGYFFWMGLLVATARQLNCMSDMLSPADAEQAEIRRWARVLRLAFYAFLVTAWFLSRTYVPTLYLVIGMTVALAEQVRQKGWVSLPGFDRRWLLTTIVLQLGSVVLIYLTMRVRSL